MGGDKSPDIYQSPYTSNVDTMGVDSILGAVTGNSVNDPRTQAFYVAQSMGGSYDAKNNVINMPDGTKMSYNPDSGKFQSQASDGTPAYTDTRGIAHPATPPTYADNAQSQKANDLASSYNQNATSSLFGSDTFGGKTYDASTGTMVDASANPSQMTGQSYLDKYGSFLQDKYNPENYSKVGPYEGHDYKPVAGYEEDNYQTGPDYQKYNYTSPTINTVDPINHDITEGIFNRQADQMNKGYEENTNQLKDTIANAGGSLSGGRAMRLQNTMDTQHQADLNTTRDQVESDAALRSFYDAQHVRDLQAAQDQSVQGRQGAENQLAQEDNHVEQHYGYEKNAAQHEKAFDTGLEQNQYGEQFNQQERGKAYDTGAAENQTAQNFNAQQHQYGFEAGQNQGKEALDTAYNGDISNRNFAENELQANRQQQLQKIQALQDFLRIYGGEDATAGQLAASQNSVVGGALNGLFGVAGHAVGK